MQIEAADKQPVLGGYLDMSITKLVGRWQPNPERWQSRPRTDPGVLSNPATAPRPQVGRVITGMLTGGAVADPIEANPPSTPLLATGARRTDHDF